MGVPWFVMENPIQMNDAKMGYPHFSILKHW